MDTAEIFQLIEQGLTLLPILVQGGIAIDQTVESLLALAKGGTSGTISAADLAKIRAQFDSDLDSFNQPIT